MSAHRELPLAGAAVALSPAERARIVASRACAEEMAQHTPEKRSAMMKNWRDYGEAGAAWHDLYDGIFDFEGLVYTPPTETFERELKLRVVKTGMEQAITDAALGIHMPLLVMSWLLAVIVRVAAGSATVAMATAC